MEKKINDNFFENLKSGFIYWIILFLTIVLFSNRREFDKIGLELSEVKLNLSQVKLELRRCKDSNTQISAVLKGIEKDELRKIDEYRAVNSFDSTLVAYKNSIEYEIEGD